MADRSVADRVKSVLKEMFREEHPGSTPFTRSREGRRPRSQAAPGRSI